MTTENRPRRVYVGNGKASRSGNPVNFSVNLDQLLELVQNGQAQSFTSKRSGQRFVKLTLWANGEEPDQYGNTHSVCLDQYVAPAKADAPGASGDYDTYRDVADSNPLPF